LGSRAARISSIT